MPEAIALPVLGTVSADGLLVTADPPLARLQEEAGATLGKALAVPQLAALVRLARSLGVTLSRPALAGTADMELDLWVRAEPVSGEVRLMIEQWIERPISPHRWRALDSALVMQAGMNDVHFQLDAELRFTHVGRELARYLGVSPEALGGVPLTRLVQLEAGRDGELPLVAAVAARRGFEGQKATVRRSDAPLALQAEPETSPDGEFIGYRGFGRWDAVPSTSAGATSDDWDALLRQPLDAIVTEAERISERAEGPLRSDYAAYASDIAGAARHLLDVLRSMGQEVGDQGGGNEPIDLAALAAEAAGLVQPQAAEAGVTLELEGAATLPVLGQPRAVTQILVNLIGNAVRYSPGGSAVRIAAESGTPASVSVSDNGPGVAEQDQERIFERFEQAEERGEGAGLGLTISRRLARAMGGDIRLESAPGKGACFTLTLPPR